MTEVLLLFIIALAVVTVVGHGIWVLVANMFRSQTWEDCPRCGGPCSAQRRSCPRCGLERRGRVADELADLEATRRQLGRFRRRDDLPPAVLRAMRRAVEERHQQLTGQDSGAGLPDVDEGPPPVPPARP